MGDPVHRMKTYGVGILYTPKTPRYDYLTYKIHIFVVFCVINYEKNVYNFKLDVNRHAKKYYIPNISILSNR